MRTEKDLEQQLENALDEVRGDAMGAEAEAQAAERVWRRLAGEAAAAPQASAGPVLGHEGYLALIPDYLAGHLSPAQRLLVEDYSRESIPFRKALKAAREGQTGTSTRKTERRRLADSPFLRLAAGLLLVAGLGLVGWQVFERIPMSWGQTAQIAELEGGLYQITEEGYLPLVAGQDIPYGKTIRTAKGSGAVVRLADGTAIEMSERAELELERRRRGTIIELSRGNIIVEAAKQRDGKLFVETNDCEVAVTGTVFSVNHGTKGSRVSVIEGRVVVDYGNREAVLTRGDQVSTHPSLGPVPVAREIAWSRNTDEYLRLLGELHELRKDIHQALATEGLRYSTSLLDLVPDGTTFYVAIPNVSGNLREAHRIIRERIETSPALRQWWQEHVDSHGLADADSMIAEAVEKIAAFGDYLGEEIVIALTIDPEADEDGPQSLLLLAETLDSAGLRTFLERELETLNTEGAPLRLIDDPATVTPSGEELLVWVRPAHLAVGLHPRELQQVAAILDDGQLNPFTTSPFYQRLAQVYADGADWLIGADVHSILAQLEEVDEREVLDRAGLLDVEYLILERQQGEGTAVHHQAVLTFDGQRRGLAGWLSAPAPMASLDFISPDANLVTAFLVKEPARLLEDLFAILDQEGRHFREELARLEAEHGMKLIDDFAAPLGGEFAFAIDGPLLPTPSWKLVMEVYDAPRLQNTIRWMVDEVNAALQNDPEHAGFSLTLTEQSLGGRTYYQLGSAALPTQVHYTFIDGYLVAGPSRALLERAFQQRASGYTLTTSPQFTALLPPDGHANFSALTYQNLKSVLGPLAQMWGGSQENLSDEQRQQVEKIVASTPATLACAYGETDRIVFVYNGEDGVFASLLGFGSALGMEQILEDAFQGKLDEVPLDEVTMPSAVAPAAVPTT